MSRLEYRKALQLILSLMAGILFLTAMHVSARAQPRQAFIIPSDDSYGIAECLLPGASCGQTLANAWCEAHGFSKSAAYGRSDDITASIVASDAPHAQPGSFIVTCEE